MNFFDNKKGYIYRSNIIEYQCYSNVWSSV